MRKHVHEQWLWDLICQVVNHDSREGAFYRSTDKLFAMVPRHKSLLHAPQNKGLPIGNLTSQFFANVYMNELDQFAKHGLHAKYYGRYVDDIVLFDENAELLNEHYAKMGYFLLERLGLRLHPNKKKLHPASQGIDFVGFIIQPNRTYLRNISISRCKQKIRGWERDGCPLEPQRLNKLGESVTSYLGMLRRVDGYRARKALCGHFNNLFIYPDSEFTKLIVR